MVTHRDETDENLSPRGKCLFIKKYFKFQLFQAYI